MRPLLILLATLFPLSAQQTMIREVYDPKTDTHVEVTALFTQPAHGGFLPVRVKVANNLNNKRAIHLEFKSATNYDDQLQTNSSFDISTDAGKTSTRDIMVPISPQGVPHSTYRSITVELSGALGKASNTIRTDTSPDKACVLLSEALYTPNASILDAERKGKAGSSYSYYGGGAFAGSFEPKQLPSEWQAFSGYDSILMTDDDWSNVPPGARNALLSWMNLGGQLAIHATGSATPSTLGIPADTGFGSLVIRNIGSDLKLPPTETLSLVDSVNPVRIRATANSSDFNSTWPLQSRFGGMAFSYGLFIGVLVIFGILVGPVNLFVFAKSGRRHRLFITTPLISLAASMVLIALIIFKDGFGGHGMRRILMEVRPDSDRNAAYVHQEQISRTGVLMGARFTVDPLCYFTPVPIATSPWARFTNSDARGGFNLQPADGRMEADGDWWQSRSEHGHTLSAVVSTRGRIERTATPQQFVSTFDFPIQTLYFLDDAGQWHRAESIATGKPFTLTPVDASMAGPVLADEANAFTFRNRHLLNRAKDRPGHFIAITGSAPGIDTFRGIRWQETHTVITGPVVSP